MLNSTSEHTCEKMAVNNNNISNTDSSCSNSSAANINNNNNNNYIKRGNLVVRVDEDSDDYLNALFDIILNPQVYNQPKQLPFRMRKLPNSFFTPPTTSSNNTNVINSNNNNNVAKLPAVHSRENSADSAFDSGCSSVAASFGNSSGFTTAQQHNQMSTVGGGTDINNGLQVVHTRAHSSPASLQQSYVHLKKNSADNSKTAFDVLLQQQQQKQQQKTSSLFNKPKSCHSKQRSYDVVSAIQLKDKLGDLPNGWEQARTAEGQIYYLK